MSADGHGPGYERLAERTSRLFGLEAGRVEWVCALPADLVERHPLVRGLRGALNEKATELARTPREIGRLQVAVAFGLRRIPQQAGVGDAQELATAAGAGPS
jgi:hypothetical protein